MSFILDNCPYFEVLVRKEYTRDMRSGHGAYLKAKAFAVWCRRSRMLGFQVLFIGEDEKYKFIPTGGAMFASVPIEALCWKPCRKLPAKAIAPWDVFSETFTVVTLDLIDRVRAFVLPRRLPGRYMFTVDFTRSDLADDPEQHKQLHVIRLDGGQFAAVPNNRLLVSDPAFFRVTEKPPGFIPMSKVFKAEE